MHSAAEWSSGRNEVLIIRFLWFVLAPVNGKQDCLTHVRILSLWFLTQRDNRKSSFFLPLLPTPQLWTSALPRPRPTSLIQGITPTATGSLTAQIKAIYTDTGNVASFGILNETREKKNNKKENNVINNCPQMVWASSSEILGTNSPEKEHSKTRKMNEEKATQGTRSLRHRRN